MISYAQNFEDVILQRCFAGKKDGFYIDVGAMDPVADSVTKFFYDEGWSGINIEPNERFYRKLMEQRARDINLNLAVGERDESRPMYVFEEYGNSTFEAVHRDRFAERGYESIERTVRITTLAAICKEYVKCGIDFLKIDCEGWETFAIKGADWDRFRPIVVVVEGTEPLTTNPSWSEWEPTLLENDRYQMVSFDGLNRYYLRREYADLRHHFDVPANVFDGFTPWATVEARQEKEILRRNRDELAAGVAELEEKLKGASAENLELRENQVANEEELSTRSASLLEATRKAGILEVEREEITKRILEAEKRLVQEQQNIAALQQDLTTSQQDIAALQQDLATAQQEIVALQRDRVALQQDRTASQQENRRLETKLVKAQLLVGQLSQELAAASLIGTASSAF